MKSIFTLLLVFAAAVAVAQPNATFDKTRHDFGRIKEGASPVAVFTITNTGDKPLIITNVSTPCGCTQPEFTQEPILPGKQGTIKVTYNSKGHPGILIKELQVTTNTTEKMYTISIQGDVIPAQTPAQPAPSEPAGGRAE